MRHIPTLYLTQGSGNSIKPMLVVNQLDITCNLRYLDVLAGETQQPAFLAINPQGAVPYMTLPDGIGLAESNAIAWYLAEGSELMPANALTRAQAVRWMNFEQTALEANISPARFFGFIAPELGADQQHMIPVWQERGNAALGFLDTYLQSHDFVTDHGYSVADIAVFGYTHLADEGGFRLADYTAVSAWIERVKAQPGYRDISELLTGENFDKAA
ncbi:MAG: glutathione S-transferase family protein [Pseudomonadota bacterium]